MSRVINTLKIRVESKVKIVKSCLFKNFKDLQYNIIQLILIESSLSNITSDHSEYQSLKKEEEKLILLIKEFEVSYKNNIELLEDYNLKLFWYNLKPKKIYTPLGYQPHLH